MAWPCAAASAAASYHATATSQPDRPRGRAGRAARRCRRGGGAVVRGDALAGVARCGPRRAQRRCADSHLAHANLGDHRGDHRRQRSAIDRFAARRFATRRRATGRRSACRRAAHGPAALAPTHRRRSASAQHTHRAGRQHRRGAHRHTRYLRPEADGLGVHLRRSPRARRPRPSHPYRSQSDRHGQRSRQRRPADNLAAWLQAADHTAVTRQRLADQRYVAV